MAKINFVGESSSLSLFEADMAQAAKECVNQNWDPFALYPIYEHIWYLDSGFSRHMTS